MAAIVVLPSWIYERKSSPLDVPKSLAPTLLETYFCSMIAQIRGTRLAGPAIFLLLVLPRLALAAALPSVPAARAPVTNSYHSTQVADDYQWLEEASAPASREWTRLENERTRAYFARLPFRAGIAQQLTQLRGEESARQFGFQGK